MAAEDREQPNMAAEDREQPNMAAEDREQPNMAAKDREQPNMAAKDREQPNMAAKDRDGEETSAGSDEQTTCRGKRRRRWWSGWSSAVGCIRRQEDGERSPPEGALQRHEEPRKMRNVLRRFVPLRRKSSPWFRTKLQKFFIRAGRRRSVPLGPGEDPVLGPDLCASGFTQIPEGPPQVQKFCYQAECLPEEPEPTAEKADPEDGPVQMAHVNQVLVRDVSSEEDEVLFDSELVVDLHDQAAFRFPPQDKTVQMSVPPQLSTNGPSIRIHLCPPDDSAQEEEEEEEGWVGVASAESHLLLICSDPSERQLLQAARSLVRTAMTAAVDQLTREQRGSGGSAHLEPPGAT